MKLIFIRDPFILFNSSSIFLLVFLLLYNVANARVANHDRHDSSASKYNSKEKRITQNLQSVVESNLMSGRIMRGDYKSHLPPGIGAPDELFSLEFATHDREHCAVSDRRYITLLRIANVICRRTIELYPFKTFFYPYVKQMGLCSR